MREPGFGGQPSPVWWRDGHQRFGDFPSSHFYLRVGEGRKAGRLVGRAWVQTVLGTLPEEPETVYSHEGWPDQGSQGAGAGPFSFISLPLHGSPHCHPCSWAPSLVPGSACPLAATTQPIHPDTFNSPCLWGRCAEGGSGSVTMWLHTCKTHVVHMCLDSHITCM